MADIEMPEMTCPKCGHTEDDYDGFGMLYCDACGYCKHPSQEGDGCCSICGEWVREEDIGEKPTTQRD